MTDTKIQIEMDPAMQAAMQELADRLEARFAPQLEAIFDPELQKFGVPAFQTGGAAAIDLRAVLNTELSRKNLEDRGALLYREPNRHRITQLILRPGEMMPVDSGVQIHVADPRFVGLIFVRSSAGKRGLALANGTGVIDSDYQGPLVQMLVNRTNDTLVIEDGERVSQYLLTNAYQFSLTEVTEFTSASERGEGGFGSTGAK